MGEVGLKLNQWLWVGRPLLGSEPVVQPDGPIMDDYGQA